MRSLITILLILALNEVKAQDPIFTQFYASPTILNPAFAGSMNSTRFVTGYRNQWLGLNSDLQTLFISADAFVGDIKSGVGANIINQKEELSGYSYTQINLLYSYHLQLTDDWSLFPGLSFGYGLKQFNLNGLLFEDQIDLISGNTNPTQDQFQSRENINLFDISAGFVFYHPSAWIGLSMRHLTNPDISFIEDETQILDTFISIHGGYRITLSEADRYNSSAEGTFLYLTGNYMHQGPFNRLDLGGEFQISKFYIGLLASSQPSKAINEAQQLLSLNPLTGVKIGKFKFGFSYDFPISDIGNSGSTAEFTLQYLLGNTYERKRRWQVKN